MSGLTLALSGCVSAGSWQPTAPREEALDSRAVAWYSGSSSNDSLGTHVAVIPSAEMYDNDLLIGVAGEQQGEDGAQPDHLYVVDGDFTEGVVAPSEDHLLDLQGSDSQRAVRPYFAYVGDLADGAGGGFVAWGSPGIDPPGVDVPPDAGVVYLIGPDVLYPSDLRSASVGPVDVTAGPRVTGASVGSKFGSAIVASPLLDPDDDDWEMVVAALGSDGVSGAAWVIREVPASEEAIVYGLPGAVELCPGGDEVVIVDSVQVVERSGGALVAVSAATAAASTVYLWQDLPMSGSVALQDATVTISQGPDDPIGTALADLGDLDGDGKADLGVRARSGWYLTAGWGIDEDTTAEALPVHLASEISPEHYGWDCRGLALVDYDHDEALDLAVGHCPGQAQGSVLILSDASDLAGEVDVAEEADLILHGASPATGSVLLPYFRVSPLDAALVVGDYSRDYGRAPDMGDVLVVKAPDPGSPP